MADQSIPEARTPKTPERALKGGSPRKSETALNGGVSESAPIKGSLSRKEGLSRRHLLGTAGATGLVLGAAGGAVGYAARPAEATPLTSLGADQVMFHGKHQPGILQALQARGHVVAFDWRRARAARRRRRCCAAGRRRLGG